MTTERLAAPARCSNGYAMAIGTKTYNERLFQSSRYREFIHRGRFIWAKQILERFRVSCRRILEIGCFDGKLVDWVPSEIDAFVGIDAGWEGGIEIAKRRFAHDMKYTFVCASDPIELYRYKNINFDLGVAMETLEHLSPSTVYQYLDAFHCLVKGHILITVPNEKGLVFLGKWLVRKIMGDRSYQFSPVEVLYAVCGFLDRVERKEHKGFDYKSLIEDIEARFEIICVHSIPIAKLPIWLSPTLGILARTRP